MSNFLLDFRPADGGKHLALPAGNVKREMPDRWPAMRGLAYDAPMQHDAAWHARISCVLSGVLRVWGVPGTVTRDPDGPGGFVVAADAGPALRLRHDVAGGWTVTRHDTESGARVPLGRHAGLPGLLRQLREDLAPGAPAGRLVIGAQLLFGRDPGGQ